MSDQPTSLRPEVNGFVALAEAARDTPEDTTLLTDEELMAAMTAAVRLYAARAEALERFAPPIDKSKVMPTEALRAISEMIRTIDVNMFDVSMWHARQGG